jgi:flagellar motor switch protein FliN/FliY
MVPRQRFELTIRLPPVQSNDNYMSDLIMSNEEELQAKADVASKKIDPDVLQNIPVTVSVEVGRTSIKIRDLMRLTQGSVVELDRLAGEPLDLLVNNTLIAQGEIVLVNERYGVRLTSVVPAAERIKNL